MSDASLVQYAPFITIFGPIVGALIGAAVTWYLVVARKKVTFWVSETEDITRPLRNHYPEIKFRVSGRDFDSLHRSTVIVKGTGNRSISDLKFDIEIPGTHIEFLADLTVDDSELRKAVKITWDEPRQSENPRFHVAVSPFMKPGEFFKVLLFFDGAAPQCLIHCRMDDVEAKVKFGDPLSLKELFTRTQPEAKFILGISAAFMAAGLGATGKYLAQLTDRLFAWLPFH